VAYRAPFYGIKRVAYRAPFWEIKRVACRAPQTNGSTTPYGRLLPLTRMTGGTPPRLRIQLDLTTDPVTTPAHQVTPHPRRSPIALKEVGVESSTSTSLGAELRPAPAS